VDQLRKVFARCAGSAPVSLCSDGGQTLLLALSGQSTLLPGRLSAIEHSNTRPATQSPSHRLESLLLSRPRAGKRDRNSAEVFLDAALCLQPEIHATVRGHGEWSQARRENFQAMLVPVSVKAKVCCVSVFGKTGNSALGKLAPFHTRPGAHTPLAM
jgi:hypothetical protein